MNTNALSSALRWGIIGCGDVCEVKSGPAFYKLPGSTLQAVMRRNGELAADFARRHGVPRWYTDAAELIKDPEVDAVYIATPPSSHTRYALAAIAAGKPVYVEKPMAHTAASAQEMADAAAKAGVKMCVAHYRRQQPLFLQVKSMLESGAIGSIRSVQLQFAAPAGSYNLSDPKVQWRVEPSVSGGGFFHDLAPHQLDLLFYFFGKPMEMMGLDANTAGQYQAPDSVGALLLFEKGIIATCHWLFAAWDGGAVDYCQVNGSAGSLRFPIFSTPWLEHIRGEQVVRTDFEPLPHVQQPMIAAVTAYFKGQAPNPCSAQAGLDVMHAMELITRGR